MDWNGKWNVNFSSSLKVYQNRSRFLVKMFRRTTDHSGHYRPCNSTTRRSLRHFWLIEEITWINIPLERFSKYFVIKGIMVSYLNKGYRVIGRIEKNREGRRTSMFYLSSMVHLSMVLEENEFTCMLTL